MKVVHGWSNEKGPPSIWGPPAIRGALRTICKGPRQSEGPINLPSLPAISGALAIRGAPAKWGALSNLKGSRQSEEPPQSEGLPAMWGASSAIPYGLPAIWEALSNMKGPAVAVWGALSTWRASSNLRPKQSESLSAIWRAPGNLRGPQQLRVEPLRAVVISLNLSSNAVNEVNHLRTCSEAAQMTVIMLCLRHSVMCCTAPHVVADRCQ